MFGRRVASIYIYIRRVISDVNSVVMKMFKITEPLAFNSEWGSITRIRTSTFYPAKFSPCMASCRPHTISLYVPEISYWKSPVDSKVRVYIPYIVTFCCGPVIVLLPETSCQCVDQPFSVPTEYIPRLCGSTADLAAYPCTIKINQYSQIFFLTIPRINMVVVRASARMWSSSLVAQPYTYLYLQPWFATVAKAH